MARGPFGSPSQLGQPGELVLEPEPVVERHVDRVEIRPPVHGDRVVEGDAQLHPDAHEQVVGQVADPDACLEYGFIGRGSTGCCSAWLIAASDPELRDAGRRTSSASACWRVSTISLERT